MSSRPAKWSTIILPVKDCLLLTIYVCIYLLSPFLGVLSTGVYAVAVVAINFFPGYGKFIGCFDAWMEEDFVTSIPRSTVVTTMVLEGDICLEEFRSLFKQNVLKAKSNENPKRIRYPELQQYLTTFMGFLVWKDDPHFQVENHIIEEHNINWSYSKDRDFMDSIHQKLLNLPYQKHRSPWEIILIRNVPADYLDLQQKNNNDEFSYSSKTVLACRMHHVLADGKSTLKLLVECLGKKPLKTAVPHSVSEGRMSKLMFHLLFPLKYLMHKVHTLGYLIKCHLHPWKVPYFWNDGDVKTVMAFSPKLSLSEIKQVAKKNGVTSSAVLLSVVAGAIQKCDKVLGQGEVLIGYPMPKPDHPEKLTNHVYVGFMPLATNIREVVKRLHACNKTFLWTKATQQARILNFTTVLGGIQLFPLTRLVVNQFAPTGITNIAGEEEGFAVGSRECVDFRMSVGTLGGVAGVAFCAFSYKDSIRVAVIAKESILRKDRAEKLALDIDSEFNILSNFV